MILVTGGLGMIGAHTARALVDLGHDVVVTSHRRTEVPSFLAGRVTIEQLDVRDRKAFRAVSGRHPISDIVHLAGSLPGPAPVDFLRTETTGLLNALDAARTLPHSTYNVSSGRPATNREFADALATTVPGQRRELVPGRQDGPGDDPYLDISGLRTTPASPRCSTWQRRLLTTLRGEQTTRDEGDH